ncbi:MAG: PAS domain S-box protein, partial [Mycobacteriales bacterium]
MNNPVPDQRPGDGEPALLLPDASFVRAGAGPDHHGWYVLIAPDSVTTSDPRTDRVEKSSDIASIRDVTERLAVELRFKAFLAAAPDATFGVDAAGKIVTANPQAERLFGYDTDELIGRAVDLLVPAASRTKHAKLRAGYAEEPTFRSMGQGQSLSAVRKDGSEFPVEISLSSFSLDGQTVVIASVRDVTERLAAAQALRVAEERFRQTL